MISFSDAGYLKNNNLKFIIFGGKGGVGKTTMSVATAIHLAQAHTDKKVLLISTDPAHSLSDSLGIPVSKTATKISLENKEDGTGKDSDAVLYACELDTPHLLDIFKNTYCSIMKELTSRGTFFDQEDIAAFFELSLPGMDEVMAIIEISKILEKGIFDILVLDTAPTGHTIRMLNLPQQMQKWIEVMDLMQHKHRYMSEHFSKKKYVKDKCDTFLDDLSSDISRVKNLLSNQDTTQFIPVMIPEKMSIYETGRLLYSLNLIKIPVKDIIVNQVASSVECQFCLQKIQSQMQQLAEIKECFSKNHIVYVKIFAEEIEGLDNLKALADYLFGIRKSFQATETTQINMASQKYLSLDPDLDMLIIGGKGGVGKTTIAASIAIHLSQKYPEKKVLVFSTDPAHSLSDSFNIPIGNKVTPISYLASDETNLFGIEINADKLFEDLKQQFKNDIEEMFNRFTERGMDIKFDRDVMKELMSLAPPGLDEIMSLNIIMDFREKKKFDIFVLDSSPTGHLLRFLELPGLVREWLNAFFRLLLKYKGAVKLTKVAERALAMSKNIRRIQESLAASRETAFIAVTIPESMSILELQRLVYSLEKAGIPNRNILMNMITPQTDCHFCSAKRMAQQKYITKAYLMFPNHMITKICLFPKEIRGMDDLHMFGKRITGNGRTS